MFLCSSHIWPYIVENHEILYADYQGPNSKQTKRNLSTFSSNQMKYKHFRCFVFVGCVKWINKYVTLFIFMSWKQTIYEANAKSFKFGKCMAWICKQRHGNIVINQFSRQWNNIVQWLRKKGSELMFLFLGVVVQARKNNR